MPDPEVDIKPQLLSILPKEGKLHIRDFAKKIRDDIIPTLKKDDPTYDLFVKLADLGTGELRKIDIAAPGGILSEISREDIDEFAKTKGNKDGKITEIDFNAKFVEDPKPRKLAGDEIFLRSGVILRIETSSKGPPNIITKATIKDGDKEIKVPISSTDQLYLDRTLGCLVSFKEKDNDFYTVLKTGELICYRSSDSKHLDKAWVWNSYHSQWQELYVKRYDLVEGKAKESEKQDKKYIIKDGSIIAVKDDKEENIETHTLLRKIAYIEKEKRIHAFVEVGNKELGYKFYPYEKETGKVDDKDVVLEWYTDGEEKVALNANAQMKKFEIVYDPENKDYYSRQWGKGHRVQWVDPYTLTSGDSRSGDWMFKEGITYVKVGEVKLVDVEVEKEKRKAYVDVDRKFYPVKKYNSGYWYKKDGKELGYSSSAYRKQLEDDHKITFKDIGKGFYVGEIDDDNVIIFEELNGYMSKVTILKIKKRLWAPAIAFGRDPECAEIRLTRHYFIRGATSEPNVEDTSIRGPRPPKKASDIKVE